VLGDLLQVLLEMGDLGMARHHVGHHQHAPRSVRILAFGRFQTLHPALTRHATGLSH